MREDWYSFRRAASLVMLSLCICSLIYLLLPKSLKSTATLILILVGTIGCCFSFAGRLRRRREEESRMGLLQEIQRIQRLTWMGTTDPATDHLSGQIDFMFETEDGEMGNRVVRVEAKHHSGGPAGRTHLWNDLPRLWELFSFILPPGPRREAFEPAFNDLTEKYALARKFRGKWARRWIGFSFSFLSIVMLLDCVRIMLQSGAGKILLKFLPDPLRTWWRRQ